MSKRPSSQAVINILAIPGASGVSNSGMGRRLRRDSRYSRGVRRSGTVIHLSRTQSADQPAASQQQAGEHDKIEIGFTRLERLLWSECAQEHAYNNAHEQQRGKQYPGLSRNEL